MKLPLGRGRVAETYQNPHGEVKPRKKSDSKAKAFLAHGFKEIFSNLLTFFLQIRYKNRRKYLNEHQTKQSKTKQNPNRAIFPNNHFPIKRSLKWTPIRRHLTTRRHSMHLSVKLPENQALLEHK